MNIFLEKIEELKKRLASVQVLKQQRTDKLELLENMMQNNLLLTEKLKLDLESYEDQKDILNHYEDRMLPFQKRLVFQILTTLVIFLLGVVASSFAFTYTGSALIGEVFPVLLGFLTAIQLGFAVKDYFRETKPIDEVKKHRTIEEINGEKERAIHKIKELHHYNQKLAETQKKTEESKKETEQIELEILRMMGALEEAYQKAVTSYQEKSPELEEQLNKIFQKDFQEEVGQVLSLKLTK